MKALATVLRWIGTVLALLTVGLGVAIGELSLGIGLAIIELTVFWAPAMVLDRFGHQAGHGN